MQITGAAVSNINKITGFLSKLYNKTAKVNIGLVGDGNNLRNSHGWDASTPIALIGQGLQRHGTGLVGCGQVSTTLFAGQGHFHPVFAGNDIPLETAVGNNFTGNMPSEWSAYLTNWGAGTSAQGAINDSLITSLGALRPYGLTNDRSQVVSTSRYTVDGNETWTNQSRPFEGITNAINMQLWYLKTNSSITGGTARTITVQKASNNNQFQGIAILNVSSTAANASGATFALNIGLTSTPGITYASSHLTLQASIAKSITAAFPSWSPTVNAIFSGINDADLIFAIQSAVAFPSESPITVNFGGLTHRYYDATYAPSLTAISYSLPLNSGNFTSYLTNISITAGSETLNVTGPAHLARRDFAVGASASRNTSIGMLWGNSLSGPWCSLFAGASISGATQGFSTTTIVDLDKQSARAQLVALRKQSNQYLGSVFQALAEHAGYTNAAAAPLLLRVHGGYHDIADAAGSTGPSGGIASNTQAGLRDNWQGIIDRVHDVYSANGWTASNLYWLFVSSPPTQANDTNLNFARLAAVDVSNNNNRTAAINMFTLNGGVTSDINNLTSISNVGSGTLDTGYQTYTGYSVYSQVEWSSIQAAYNANIVPNTPPVAQFTFSPSPAYDHLGNDYVDVLVNASSSSDSDGSITNYLWDYTDDQDVASQATGVTASLRLGVRSNPVYLMVTDDDGATGATSTNIVVNANPVPVANFTANPSLSVPLALASSSGVTFDASSSTDTGGSIASYYWSISNGKTASTQVAGFTFGAAGTYSINLMVTDNGGATGATAKSLIVSSGNSTVTPAITVASPSNPAYDNNNNGSESFVLSAANTVVVGASVQSYLWSNGSSGVTAAYNNIAIGTTTASVLVTDTLGATGATSITLQVLANPGPSVSFTVSPSNTVTDNDDNGVETLYFDAAGSTDSSGISAYNWTVSNGLAATGVTTQFTLTAGSSYTVMLMVTDSFNITGTSSQTVTVNNRVRGPGAVSSGSSIWFAGKVYTQQQYIELLQRFYPNLLR